MIFKADQFFRISKYISNELKTNGILVYLYYQELLHFSKSA